jgi:hypothetical protein
VRRQLLLLPPHLRLAAAAGKWNGGSVTWSQSYDLELRRHE